MVNRSTFNALIRTISSSNLEFSVFDIDNDILTPEDSETLFSYFDIYNAKHEIELLSYSSSGIVKISSPLVFQLYNFIFKLNETDFERLCAKLCFCFGFNYKYFVTKKSHDQGIDIIAFRINRFIKSENDKEYIIGQCKKHRDALVNVREIRELSGSISLLKMKEFSQISEVYSDHQLASFTPTNAVFFTSYFFSEFAESLCRHSAILTIDLVDLIYICIKGINNGILNWKSIEDSNKINTKNIKDDLRNIIVEK